ncbi:hypothetical protein GCM10027443_29970 [Pontibacter brevis]
MKDFSLALAVVSFLLLASGLIYKRLKRSVISEPILAVGAGILLGPFVLDLIDLKDWGPFEATMEVACMLTISMALMATAFRMPKSYLAKHWRLQSIMLFGGMLGMWACSTFLIRLIFGFDWLLCMLIGATVTPTDPVIASTIVAGETAKKLLPDRVRHAISFESGANDGLAYPIVLLPLLLIQKPAHALQEWLLKSILWETGGGVLFGLVIGYVAGKLLLKAREANWMSETALLSFSLALGLFVLGLLEVIGCNGIIGVFAAGFATNLVLNTEEDVEQEEVQEAMERIFTIPIFFFFGLILPWEDWFALGWKAVAIVVAVLLLRRLPVFLVLAPFLKSLPKKADVAIVGWFGPIGVAALFYMVHSLQKVGMQEVWVVGTLIVFGSTLVHGFTGYMFAKWYHEKAGTERLKAVT